jgi:hypothetical protein
MTGERFLLCSNLGAEKRRMHAGVFLDEKTTHLR